MGVDKELRKRFYRIALARLRSTRETVKVKATDGQGTDYSLLSIIENRIYLDFNVFSSIEPHIHYHKKNNEITKSGQLSHLQFQFTWCIFSLLLMELVGFTLLSWRDANSLPLRK